MENGASCSTCQFFTKPALNTTAYGECVRYPEPIGHVETFWCGEYRERGQAVQIKEPSKRKN